MDDILQAVLESEAEQEEAQRRADEARAIIAKASKTIWPDADEDPEESEKAIHALEASIAQTDPVYAAHFRAMQAGANCQECPLYGCRRGPVPGDVVHNARLTIIGEAPGKNEVEEGRPFIGASGRELDEALEMGGLERRDCTVTNTVLCRPPPKESMESYLQKLNRRYTALVKRHRKENKARKKRGEAAEPLPKKPLTPIECCSGRLKREIEVSNTKTILAVGGKALNAMADHFGVPYAKGKDVEGEIKVATIMNQHGAPVPFPVGHKMADGSILQEDKILCSSLHPAFAMRGARHYKSVIRDDICRAATIVRRGNKIDWHEPEYHLFIKGDPGSVQQVDPEDAIQIIEMILDRFVRHGAKVAYDIETDSKYPMTCRVRCVGLGAVIDGEEQVIVVPFRWMDGRDYWPRADLKRRAARAVRAVLDSCKLIAHNGAFDSLVCTRVGLMTNRRGRWFDTMIAHHDTDHNDLPHTLGFVTTRFLETPMWKQDVDHKDANCERDSDLHLYNARDVLCTLRIAYPLRDRVAACATGTQFSVDTNVAPTAREMQRLGVFINEYERGRLSVKFNKLTYTLSNKFKAQVRKISKNVEDINPGSPQQLASWLYDEMGLDPVINTQGYEFQDGDSASTSAEALIRLIANGVTDEVADALDTLMQFKACEKLRSTYVDNLHVRQVDDFNHLPKVKAARFLLNREDVEAYAGNQDIPIKEAAKAIGKWHEMLPERGLLSIINPTWKIHVVPTGRWSSSPNVQNWPARAWGGVNTRSMIVAPPGHVIVGADYAQIELRLYALQSGDEFLLRAFSGERGGKPIDPHTLNAATLLTKDDSEEGIWREYDRINQMDPDEKKYYRTVAKRFVFLEAYGGEEEKLFSVMSSERDKATNELVFPDIVPEDCDRWHKNWHRLHPWTKQWQNRCARFQRAHGFVETLIDGRKRYFLGGPNKKNAVPNHTIQGSAAAICNQAVLKIAEEIPFGCWSPYTGLCLQVHDYIGVYVPVEKAEEAGRIIKKCMFTEIDGMPFPADEPKPTWSWAGQ